MAERNYDAFISYAHARDRDLAAQLRYSLQKIARPWYRRRALRIYLDESDLPLTRNLWAEIEGALSSARFFVLLASPEAAASEAVGREVAYWLEHRELETIVLALTGGEFDTALPRALVGAYKEPPKYADLRPSQIGTDLSLKNAKFRAVVAEVAARVHETTVGELVGRDVREHKRTILVASIAVVLLLVLAAASIVALVRASQESSRAESEASRASQESGRADSEATKSLAGRLAAQGMELVQTGDAEEVATGSLLVLESLERETTLQGHRAWAAVVNAWPPLVREFEIPKCDRPNSGAVLAVSPEGKWLAACDESGRLRIWDLGDGKLRHELAASQDPVSSLAYSPDGVRLAVGHSSGEVCLRWSSSLEIDSRIETPCQVNDLAFSEDGERLVTAGLDWITSVWKLPSGKFDLGLDHGVCEPIVAELSPNREWLATTEWNPKSEEYILRVWSMATRRPVVNYLDKGLRRLDWSPDSSYLVAGGTFSSAAVWAFQARSAPDNGFRPQVFAELGFRPVDDIEFAPDGRIIAIATRSGLHLWDFREQRAVAFVEHPDACRVEYVDKGRRLITAALDQVRVWNVGLGKGLAEKIANSGRRLREEELMLDLIPEVSRRIGRGLTETERQKYLGGPSSGVK